MAQSEVAKHKPESFYELLLNLLDDGIGLAAVRALIFAVFHQGLVLHELTEAGGDVCLCDMDVIAGRIGR